VGYNKLAPIEDRLMGTLKFDAIHGDDFELDIVESQIKEAVEEIKRLRLELLEARK